MVPEHLATDPPKEKGQGWWVMQFPAIIRRLSRTIRGIWLDAAEDPGFADILLSAFCIRIFGDGTAPSAPSSFFGYLPADWQIQPVQIVSAPPRRETASESSG